MGKSDRQRRVLVLRAGALGDVVLSLPALRALRALYPDASLEVVGYPAFWQVAAPLVDAIHSIDSPLFAGLNSEAPSAELQAWLQDVDLVVAWTARDPGPALRAAGVPGVLHASPYPPPGVHAAAWLLETVSLRGTCGAGIDLQAEELEASRELLARIGAHPPTILHPGAGALWKRWPAERFALLAGELVKAGHQMVLVEGPADAEAVAEVRERAGINLPTLRGASVRELAGFLVHAALFVGNDSGVTHLAAAIGVPTIALFGPTDPANWSPLGDVRVLRACDKRTVRRGQMRVCEDLACMEGITVERVIEEIARLR
jgi:ADP-heptose:LPS heptosyltransferase